jgi:hypothetical protein
MVASRSQSVESLGTIRLLLTTGSVSLHKRSFLKVTLNENSLGRLRVLSFPLIIGLTVS